MSGPGETRPEEGPPLAAGEAPTLALPPGLAAPTQVGAPPPALLAAAAVPMPPRVIDGRYELLATLGAGGMGVVWRARDREAGREVALKLLRADSRDQDALERFRREGEATAALDHPGIVRVHAAGVAGEQAWLVYELVEGARTLSEALPGLDLRRRIELLRDVARALAHAHAQGIVHRDVKPDNALLDPAGRVRVADFGLALLPGRERLTQSGALMGTPSYMAPEQASGERARIGPPTDVWSLGVMLYEALTGALPYQAPTLVMLIARITRGPPAAPGKVLADVPPDLDAVCMRALAQEPGDRHPHAGAFADDLQAWLDGRPLAPAPPPRGVRRSPLRWALALALVPPLFALRAWLTAPEEYPPDQWPRPRDPARLLGPVPSAAPPAPQVAALASAPPWARALPPAALPSLPLPAGVSFGPGSGEYVNEADGSVLVWVPPGELLMGAASGDAEAEDDERPARRVRLSRGLFLGKHELSWGHYRRFCFETGRALPLALIEDHPGRFEAQDDHPVFHVTWQDAADYCQRFGLRLPSEAEWERGARGDDSRVYPWGNAPPRPDAPPPCNVADEAARRAAPGWRTTAGYDDQEAYLGRVDAFPEGASSFGCLNMAGNVWEWVADWYAPYDPALLLDPPGPPSGEDRVIRGGSWCFPLADGRASNRNQARPELRYDYVGFRVAR